MQLKKVIVIFVLVSTMFPLLPLGATTITVANDGSGDHSSIQVAVEAAERGDTVFVKAGTYYECGIILDKEISLKGEGPDVTKIVRRTEQNQSELFIVRLDWRAEKIEGFSLTWDGDRPGNGVIVSLSQYARLSRCRIMNCHVGVWLHTDADFPNKQVISGNTISDNEYGVVWRIVSIPGLPIVPLHYCKASNNWWGVTSEAEIKSRIAIYNEADLKTWGLYDEFFKKFFECLKPWLINPVEIENLDSEVEKGIHYNNIYANDVNLVLLGTAELTPVRRITWGEVKNFYRIGNKQKR